MKGDLQITPTIISKKLIFNRIKFEKQYFRLFGQPHLIPVYPPNLQKRN